MPKTSPKVPATAVTFHAPIGLVEQLDRLARRELMTRSTLLRRLAAKAAAEGLTR